MELVRFLPVLHICNHPLVCGKCVGFLLPKRMLLFPLVVLHPTVAHSWGLLPVVFLPEGC